jgi:hypothetical protein
MVIVRRIVAGAGALMACALITLISMVGSQWVKDHPGGSEVLGVVLFIGCAGCFIFWVSTRDRHSTIAAPGITTEQGSAGII